MVQLKLEVVIPAEGQRSNAAVKDNVDNVLVHVRKGIRMGLKQPQQPVFRFLLPHLDQVHDHDPGIAVQARIRYPHAADVFQMVGKAARTDALQDGAVPDGAYRRAVQVRIVKFGHVSIQQHVHVQVNHPVVPGEQGGGQQASICEGGEPSAIPVLQNAKQPLRKPAKPQRDAGIAGNGFSQFLHLLFLQSMMNDMEFIIPPRIGMHAKGAYRHGQRDEPGGSDGEHDGNGRFRHAG